jgi:ABC-type antimicrobial peptide transport system permease subunit
MLATGVVPRTYELGVRIALGASASNILRLNTSRGFALVASGLDISIFASLLLFSARRCKYNWGRFAI